MTDIDSLKEDERVMLRSECYRLGHRNISLRKENEALRREMANLLAIVKGAAPDHDQAIARAEKLLELP